VNVVMTGVLPKKKGGMGWLNIGRHNKWSMVLPERGPWISRWLEANVPELVRLIQKQDKDMLIAIQTLPEEAQREYEAMNPPPAIYMGARDESKEKPEPVLIEDHAQKIQDEKSRESITNILLSKVMELWRNN
jgi:hypothetical protein